MIKRSQKEISHQLTRKLFIGFGGSLFDPPTLPPFHRPLLTGSEQKPRVEFFGYNKLLNEQQNNNIINTPEYL